MMNELDKTSVAGNKDTLTVSVEERIQIMLDVIRKLQRSASTGPADLVLRATRSVLENAIKPGLIGAAMNTPAGDLVFNFLSPGVKIRTSLLEDYDVVGGDILISKREEVASTDKVIESSEHIVHHFSPEDDARIARLSAFHESIELEGKQTI